jgi:hypothetical protein
MTTETVTENQTYKVKPLRIQWTRSHETIKYNVPQVVYAEGTRGSGKGVLLENFAMNYLSYHCAVLDLFGAVDAEGLAWLRSPFIKNLNVLLLKGPSVDVKCDWDVMETSKLGLNDFYKYDLIISARPLFINKDSEYTSVGQVTELLYKRFSWNRIIFMLVREASSLWHSRLMISKRQTDVKSESVYMLRESRHLGLGLGLDSLKYTSIDADVRVHFDYMFVKAHGIEGLNDDMKWLYYFFNPSWIQSMLPREFIVVSRRGPLGVGVCPWHSWHKIEGENILNQLGFKIEYGEVVEEGEDKGNFSTVGDPEHAEIIDLYVGNSSVEKIAAVKGRSTATISKHIKKHNQAVERSQFCALCKRANGVNYATLAKRNV